MSLRCELCNRDFKSSSALQAHNNSTTRHANRARCDRCDRSFVSESALQAHLANSGAHNEARIATSSYDWVAPAFEQMAELLHIISLGDIQAIIDSSEPSFASAGTSTLSSTSARATLKSAGNSNSGYTCPLCLDRSDELSSVICGHVFCTPCIRAALEERRQCPLCRKDAHPRDLRRTFFSTGS